MIGTITLPHLLSACDTARAIMRLRDMPEADRILGECIDNASSPKPMGQVTYASDREALHAACEHIRNDIHLSGPAAWQLIITINQYLDRVVEQPVDMTEELRAWRESSLRKDVWLREAQDTVASLSQQIAKAHQSLPIPMVLHCPECRARHVDAGEFATKAHHTHACQACGLVWRPAICPTVGVQFLPGFKDEAAAVDSSALECQHSQAATAPTSPSTMNELTH